MVGMGRISQVYHQVQKCPAAVACIFPSLDIFWILQPLVACFRWEKAVELNFGMTSGQDYSLLLSTRLYAC